MAEIDQLSHLDFDAVSAESKYLLEIDFSSLKNESLVSQSYWLFAIKAAKTADQRALLRSQCETGGVARRLATREDQVRAVRATYATHDLATGRLSTLASSPYYHICTEPAIVSGAREVLNSIHSSWSLWRPPSCSCPSEAVGALTQTDVKRRNSD